MPLRGIGVNLHQITGEFNGLVNSYHNFSIEKCPDNCVVTAKVKMGK